MSEQQNEYKIEGRPATIFRVAKTKENPYVMIDKRVIDNKELSFKAKGILTYLLSRPDGWEVNLVDLSNRGTDGVAAIKSGVKELKDAGYLKHAGTRKASGQFDTVIWEVYEAPQVDNRLTDEPYIGVSPQVEKPQADNPQADNRIQVLSTLSNNESNKYIHTDKIDFVNLSVNEAMRLPELQVFRDTTGRVPGQGQYETVWNTIRRMNGNGNAEYLRPFWLEWSARGYNSSNLNWLTDWAVAGIIPDGKPKAQKYPNKVDSRLERLAKA
jgi:hypothetical protein